MSVLFRRYCQMLDWYLPYTKEAAVILRNNFNDYWFDIKAFGDTHPEYIPYINQDPLLICALLNVGYERRIDGIISNTGFRSSSFQKGSSFEVSVDFIHINQTTDYSGFLFWQGTAAIQSGIFLVGYTTDKNTCQCFIESHIGNITLTQNTRYTVRAVNGSGVYVNGTKLKNTTNVATGYNGPLAILSKDIKFFGAKVIDTANSINWNLVPTITSVNTVALIDTNSASIKMTTNGSCTSTLVAK